MEEDKYIEFMITDPDTTQELLDSQQQYLQLTPEEQREWRYQNLPKMNQVAIWNFYWKYLRHQEDKIGTEQLGQQIDDDIPYLETTIKQLTEELARVQQQYQQLQKSRAADEAAAPDEQSNDDEKIE